ncbi:hypothetical protein RHGRI_006489 [Rhododendron griersonianum]|uniref:Disease resistance protein RGA3 n=1 Tax=Rhododendron griersonianum TaxID=479676 RepID=A0AAV6KT90_9ERIC|nr:hypothetical protein RHGRI_006489 [Rhododendron griersonianum]
MAAEKILSGVAATVLSCLGSYAIQEIGLAWGLKKDLRKMEIMVSTIKNVLLDAQERQMSSRAVKEWLEKLELILYDASDLLDEVATETKTTQVETQNSLVRKVHYFFTSSNPLVFRYVVGRKIRDIGKRLDEIVLQRNAFKFVVKLVERPIQINRREETFSFANTPTIIGRDADKEKLVRLLLSPGDEENVAIIPIVGMGGLGKTTLAQLVYNDDRIQKHFTKRLWICISNNFDVKRILIKLLQAGDSNGDASYSNEGLEQLQNRARNVLCEDNCYNLTSLGEGIEHLSSLWELAIMRCYKLVSLPTGLRHLTSLEVLEIHSCESLNFSDDNDFKGLTSLNTLSLKNLRGLVSLPKGLQDAAATLTHLDILECLNFTSPSESVLPNLLSLQSLTIGECHKVESLPEGMQRLTKLLNLTIYSYNLNTSSYREVGKYEGLVRSYVLDSSGLEKITNQGKSM